MILVVCGVCGSGKSTIGYELAEYLNLPFFDGDDFHPLSNVEKMRNGRSLTDEDRQPWLESLAENIAVWERKGGAILACSALKESYRKTLSAKCESQIKWIILNGSRKLLLERLSSRTGHFVDSRLLDSQLDTLELPNYGWVIDINKSPTIIVNNISALINLK